MNVTPGKRVLSVALCFAVIAVTMPIEIGALMFYQDQQAAPAPTSSSSYPGQGTPMSAQELQSLVAPIAL